MTKRLVKLSLGFIDSADVEDGGLKAIVLRVAIYMVKGMANVWAREIVLIVLGYLTACD